MQRDLNGLVIRRCLAAETIDLRHRVLRQGLPRDSAIFAGDDLPTSHHFGAFDGDRAVCCATFHAEPYDGQPAWRLRGMATDDAWRGQGVGRQLLALAEAAVTAGGAPLLWCNARVAAIKFYERAGWRVVTSELFDVPTAGLHHRMVKRVGQT